MLKLSLPRCLQLWTVDRRLTCGHGCVVLLSFRLEVYSGRGFIRVVSLPSFRLEVYSESGFIRVVSLIYLHLIAAVQIVLNNVPVHGYWGLYLRSVIHSASVCSKLWNVLITNILINTWTQESSHYRPLVLKNLHCWRIRLYALESDCMTTVHICVHTHTHTHTHVPYSLRMTYSGM